MNDTLNEIKDSEITSPIIEEEQKPEPIDAVIHVSLSKDKLAAFIEIEPPMYEGAPPTLEKMKEELSRCNVVYGIDEEKLEKLSITPCYNSAILIAEGYMCENGTDGTYSLKFEAEKDLKPKEREDGTTDYMDLGFAENVVKGQVLCKITLPTDGTEGKTVTGEAIRPIRGRAVPNLLGKNTGLSADGTSIVSNINGQVEFIGRRINVNETLIIKEDVDSSTGNIKVNSNVIVKGIVSPGYSVEADGNIEIRGTVASVKLNAGGNITLYGGIQGSDLICGGDLNSKFIEDCNVTTKGNVKSGHIMNSSVHCGKVLTMSGPLGRFAGGSCVVGQDMLVQTIGFPSGVVTVIELGTDPSILERQQELLREIPELENQLPNLKRLIDLLEQFEEANRLDEEKRRMLDTAQNSYETSIELIINYKQELEEIEEFLRMKGYGRIKCTKTIHPGTLIKIGNAKLEITEQLTNVTLYNADGEVHHMPNY
ncbi:MAG TPA: hypothetical protein DD733_12710 [Clostridiales bacterium]|nr:FapA family protein [Eubacteriales bacterium]HBR32931.1 hypothetical protein [Clostridiales bacterium]